jgi:two-component system sensor histidine kinase KdpD
VALRPRIVARLASPLRGLIAEPMGFVWGALVNTITTTVSYFVEPHAQLAHLMILHLLGAVLVSTRFGYAVSAFTAITSVLAFDYFCIPPILAFALPDRHSVVTFVGMLITALTICFLIQRLRRQTRAARESEARTLQLCELSLDLSAAVRFEELPAAAENHLEALFGAPARVLLCGEQGELDLGSLPEGERARAAAALARRSDKNLETGGGVAYQCIGRRSRPLGLIRLEAGDPLFYSTAERRMLLAACADRIGVAVERVVLGDTARRAHVEAETERLRNALLSAVSHDLRTPLASILAAGTTLLRADDSDHVSRRELLETVVQETERLNALVTNLLSVTRLEAGGVRLNKIPEALDDLVAGVLSRFSGRLQGRAVKVDAPDELPLVAIDPVLIDQVIANLVENVLVYTPADSPVEIGLEEGRTELVLWIRDRGPGIPEHERAMVFERFYRGGSGRLKHGGTGLGLTICRAVARVHGGRIEIHARPGGGTAIEFALPLTSSEGAEVGGTAAEPMGVFA